MHILILKTSSLGDIIQVFPAVTALKKHFPDALIDWVAEKPFCELLEAHPLLNRVIPIEGRKWKKEKWKSRQEIKRAIQMLRFSKYDLLFDFQGNIKSGLITLFTRAFKKVGYTFTSAPEWPNSLCLSHRYLISSDLPMQTHYFSLVQKHFKLSEELLEYNLQFKISAEEECWIDKQLKGKSSPSFMVCMGSQWENKKLSLQTWTAFLKKIHKEVSPFLFFVWGSEKEKQEAETLHEHFSSVSQVLPRMRLPVGQRLMERMDYILATDSGALHLAATTSTSTFSVFGPSHAKVYQPMGERHHAFQGECPYGRIFEKRCPILRTCKTGACLKDAPSEKIAEQFLLSYSKERSVIFR